MLHYVFGLAIVLKIQGINAILTSEGFKELCCFVLGVNPPYINLGVMHSFFGGFPYIILNCHFFVARVIAINQVN